MRAFDDKEMEGILRPIIASSDGVDSGSSADEGSDQDHR